MPDNMRPVSTSAAAHAERIRASEGRAENRKPSAGQSTAERIAARILPGYKADAALREEARLRELKARGVITAEAEIDEEYDVVVDEEVDEDEEEAPSTAELYARRERARQKAERAATLVAHRSVGQVSPPPQVHRLAEQLAQPYRRTPGGYRPAS